MQGKEPEPNEAYGKELEAYLNGLEGQPPYTDKPVLPVFKEIIEASKRQRAQVHGSEPHSGPDDVSDPSH